MPKGRSPWFPKKGQFLTNERETTKLENVAVYVSGSDKAIAEWIDAAKWTQAMPNTLGNWVTYGKALAVELPLRAVSKLPGLDVRSPRLEKIIQSMPVSSIKYQGHAPSAAINKDVHPFGSRGHGRDYPAEEEGQLIVDPVTGEGVRAFAFSDDAKVVWRIKQFFSNNLWSKFPWYKVLCRYWSELPWHDLLPDHIPRPETDPARDRFIASVLENPGSRERIASMDEATLTWDAPDGHPWTKDRKAYFIRLKPLAQAQ
jgi:hypothetical protein